MPTPIDRLSALLDDGNAALDRGDLDGARPLLLHAHDWVGPGLEQDPDRGAELQLWLRDACYRLECDQMDADSGRPARVYYLAAA